LEKSDIDTRFSGTTACTITISEELLISANLGDSRAVLYRKN
jgi:serine/threonine protein phosphatase PrpC